MTEKRFVKGYCCGDTGLVDKGKEEWFVENINSVSDLERNWNDVLDKLNEVADENVQLKKCNSKAKNHIEDIIFLLNNTPSQTLSKEDLITLVQKTKEYLE